MQRQLQERDALIRNLQQRVEALERRLGAQHPGPAAAPAPSAAPQAPTPSAAFEEDETARALERALVREGGFTLRPGTWEIEPRFEYQYRGARGVAIVQGTTGPVAVDRSQDRHRSTATLGLRAGLRGNSQVEVRLPWVAAQESTTAAAAGLQQNERRTGVGDVELQVTQQLGRSRSGRPALLASAHVRLPTGDFEPGRPSTGSGFVTAQGALTAVKRQDPLVFFGTVSYGVSRSHSYVGSRLRPGNTVGLRAGTLLAASPETSLRTALDISRSDRSRFNGQEVAGTSVTSGVVELGLSSLIGPRALLDVNLGFGITPDAPDLRLSVSIPVRF